MEDDAMMFNYEIDYYVNLQRIKKCEKETNSELDYQLKVQKSKLQSLGVNTDDFEYTEQFTKNAIPVENDTMSNQELCILLESILALLETNNAEKAKDAIKRAIILTDH